MNSLHAKNATSVKECKTIGNLKFFLTNLYEKNGSGENGKKYVLDAIQNSKHLYAGEFGIYTIHKEESNMFDKQILLVELPWNISAQEIQTSLDNFSFN